MKSLSLSSSVALDFSVARLLLALRLLLLYAGVQTGRLLEEQDGSPLEDASLDVYETIT